MNAAELLYRIFPGCVVLTGNHGATASNLKPGVVPENCDLVACRGAIVRNVRYEYLLLSCGETLAYLKIHGAHDRAGYQEFATTLAIANTPEERAALEKRARGIIENFS